MIRFIGSQGGAAGKEGATARKTTSACVHQFRIVSLGLVLALVLLLAGPVGSSHAVTASFQAQSSRVASAATRSVSTGDSARSSHVGLRRVSIARFTATPSALSASGGRVRLQAVMHGATKCRFSSARTLKGLPSTKRCRSGRASVSIKLPKNTTSSTKTYGFDLTASGARGATSATRRLIVIEHAPNRAAVAPVITKQPTSRTVAGGAYATFTAAASGKPTPSVQWQVSVDGGSTWANIAGATSKSYGFTASTSGNGYEYRAVFRNAAGSATTHAATLTVAPESSPVVAPESSTFQSGYTAYAPTPTDAFSAVSVNWTMPTVACPPGANTNAAQWPGIGDATSVVQEGTQEFCSSGTPSYGAFCELYEVGNPIEAPCSLPPSSYPVSPGDAIAAAVSISGSTWTLSLTDTTKGWTFTFTTPNTSPGLSQGSAEVIAECPNSGSPPSCPSDGLSNFGAVRFTGATADLDGKTAPITAFSPIALQMASGSTLLAAPGPLDPEGDFTDTWYAY